MASLNDTSPGNEVLSTFTFNIPIPVRFWLFLISNVLSILCSCFVLYCLLFDRTLRRALNNHFIIILLFNGLIYELIDVPMMLHFYRFGDAWKLTPSLFQFWPFIDYICYTTEILVFAWASIERHILVFHNRWVSTKKKRFFIHYLPLLTLPIYCFIYYFFTVIFLSCKTLSMQSAVNGVPIPCIFFYPIIGSWETMAHQIIPTFTISIFNVALILRVLWQKTRLRRAIQWRKQRKMIIQLLPISILYLLFNFPWIFIQFCYLVGLPVNGAISTYYYGIFLSIYIIFLFPFVCCGSLHELRKKLKRFFFNQRQMQVVPT
jgi:hypothetical protein